MGIPTPPLIATATFTIAGGAANGCDSIVTLDLTISNSVSGTDTQISLRFVQHGLMGIPTRLQTIRQHSPFQVVQQMDATLL